jgi:ribose transport system permease protein
MKILCSANGKLYLSNWKMWMVIIPDVAVTVACAMGIGLQFKNGRFDFSGGAIMLLSVIVAGSIARDSGTNSPMLFCVIAVGMCVLLSVGVAVVYVYGRLPIMIATIGMALLYESITPLIFGGGGVNLISVTFIKQLRAFPTVLIPFGCAVAVYAVYNYVATTGKQSLLLAKNQQSAVNIGINEDRNVIISYVYSGLIFGFATIIWASMGKRDASFTSLSTVGELFSNILPVFVGLYIGVFCGDTIGIIMGSLAIVMMKTGLTTVFKAELGGAISTAMMGIFVFIVNLVAGQSKNIKKFFLRLFRLPSGKAVAKA